MKQRTTLMLAAVFAVVSASPAVLHAQTQKRDQADKGTPAQGTVQKKDQGKSQAKDKKKDGSGEGKQAKGSK